METTFFDIGQESSAAINGLKYNPKKLTAQRRSTKSACFCLLLLLLMSDNIRELNLQNNKTELLCK